jgi:hypothetical protein
LGFVNAWGFDLLKILKIFREYVDLWGQEIKSSSSFLGVLLMHGGNNSQTS